MSSLEEADRVLQLRRPGKACYPCAKRKIRCSGVYPCETCQKRGHPDICIVVPPKPRGPRPKQSRQRDAGAHHPFHPGQSSGNDSLPGLQSYHPGPPGHNPHNAIQYDVLDDSQIAPSYMGDYAEPSLIHNGQQGGTEAELVREIRPALGLQNTGKAHPFLVRQTPAELTKLINDLIPSHADILKYSQFYQSVFAPFFPLVADSDDLEDIICYFLERASLRERSGVPVFETVTKPDMVRSSLLLAIVARGCQLSELPTHQRVPLSREFARAAYQCARQANSLLRPEVETVQALFLCQYVLQNDGQADGSWAWLGTIIRLAQSLGLHREPSSELPEKEQKKRRRLWAMLMSQDCHLSLAFDRPPFGNHPRHAFMEMTPSSSVLAYYDSMDMFTLWGRSVQEADLGVRNSLQGIQRWLGMLDEIQSRGAPHIQSIVHCSNRQARIEHYIVRLHLHANATIVCRPALKMKDGADSPEYSTIMQRFKIGLVETMAAFLGLQSLTTLPLRCWAFIHAALSAAILFEYFGYITNDPEARSVQTRFISLLSMDRPINDKEAALHDEACWLSAAHLHALKALRNSVAKTQEMQTPTQNIHPDLLPLGQQQRQQLYNNIQSSEGETPRLDDLRDLWSDDLGNFDWSLGFLNEDDPPVVETNYGL